MLYAALELGIRCPKCDNPVPLNGPWQEVHCDHCQADVEVPNDFWESILNDALREVKYELQEGEGQNSTIFGHFNVMFMYGRLHARCERCKTQIDVAADIREPYVFQCPKCGCETPVGPVPSWFVEQVPAARAIINATTSAGGEEKGPLTGQLVVFNCPKCGGALDVDGKDRVLSCKYCGVNVYLPDDLWLRMHPAKSKERWFLAFDENVIPKQEDE